MEFMRTPQSMNESSQAHRFEAALQGISLLLSSLIFILTCGLLYIRIQETGFPFQGSGYFLTFLLGSVALSTISVLMLMQHYRQIWRQNEREAGSDKLTGAINRDLFDKLLEQELRRGGRYHYPITLCYVGLDGFKNYKEESSREQSDLVIKKFAETLKSSVRFADCVARYENDEFCVLLPHTDLVHAEKYIHRLLAYAAERTGVTFSAGVAAYQAGEKKAQFMMRAISSLTQAKSAGKSQVRYAVGDGASAVIQP